MKAKIKSNFDNIRKTPNGWEASCPAHVDDDPSLQIALSDNKILIECRAGCSKENILSSLGWDWGDLFLDEKSNGYKSNGSQKPVSEFKKPLSWLNRDLHESVEAYFTKRGINDHALKYNNIGWQTDKFIPQVEENRRVILFPFIRDNKIRNVKYRDTDKNFLAESDGEKLFFGHQKLEHNPDVILITEGEIDVLSFDSLNIDADIEAVSVFNGANSNLDEPLDYAQEYFADCDQIILAVDDDEPGHELQRELAKRLGRNKCRIVQYPDECKDLNDVLRKYSKKETKKIIKNAEPFPINGVYTASDLKDEIYDLYDKGYQQPLSTGWDSLDEYYKVRPGEITIISGVPNHGKSVLSDCLAINMAKLHDWNVAITSPENHPPKRHMSMVANRWVKKPFDKNNDNRMSKNDLKQAVGEMDNKIHWIMPEQDEMSVDNIIEMVKVCIYRYNIKGFLLDPWSALSHQRGQYQSEKIYISESLSRFRRLARENEIHIWIVAHPNKSEGKTENYVPDLYDISGASEWNDFADAGLIVWRDKEGNEYDSNRPFIHVKKIRYQECGKLGKVQMKYNRDAKVLEDLYTDDEEVEF